MVRTAWLIQRAARAVRVAALGLWLAGCGTTYHMGDAIQAKREPAGEPRTEDTHRDASTEQRADRWNQDWKTIQSSADSVSWVDHFHVCGLKYRFRHYDELFRCLDLLDAKIAAGGALVPKAALVQRGAPVVTNWLRATAYAELGDPQTALRCAELSWMALPAAYRQADSVILGTHFSGGSSAENEAVEHVSHSLGSDGMETGNADINEMFHQGRNNPAALDLRPWMIAMSLAVQRSLLYQTLGRPAESDAAMEDLRRWEQTHPPGGFNSLPASQRPFRGRAQMLAIGPLYARGNYQRVANTYEILAAKYAHLRRQERRSQSVSWALFLPLAALQKAGSALLNRALFPADTRLFAVAVEDAANALLYAQSLLQLGRTDAARDMLDTLLAMPELPAMGNLYWVALYQRGRIALQAGERDKGVRLLAQSVSAIEAVRSSISFEAAKIGFAGDKQAVYAALVGALADAGQWTQAFEYAERARARALVDLLAERRNMAPPPTPDEKVRALFMQAATAERSMGLANDDERRRGIQVVADARASLATVAPQAASLLSVQQIPVTEIANRLDAGDVLLEYFLAGEQLVAFVLEGNAIRGVRLRGQGLETEVRELRGAISRRDGRAAEMSRQLYDRLLRPVFAELPGNRLTIAPHGILHYLPFDALMDGDRYLIDRVSLRITPSAAVLAYLPSDRPRKAGTLLALGNPDLGDRALDLPNAQAEAVQVAALFPNSRALLRADASKSAIKELGNGFSMLHFATHGSFNADAPLSSGLYLARGRESDGVLTVGDLYTLQLDTDLVTLSACETGLGRIANGDDVIGLTRGFLYAGARTIVASLWEVDDAATAQLMESFYRNLAQHDKREALRLAQIETRRSHPEPWYWAGFIVEGRAD